MARWTSKRPPALIERCVAMLVDHSIHHGSAFLPARGAPRARTPSGRLIWTFSALNAALSTQSTIWVPIWRLTRKVLRSWTSALGERNTVNIVAGFDNPSSIFVVPCGQGARNEKAAAGKCIANRPAMREAACDFSRNDRVVRTSSRLRSAAVSWAGSRERTAPLGWTEWSACGGDIPSRRSST
jgi:hypothetical protein